MKKIDSVRALLNDSHSDSARLHYQFLLSQLFLKNGITDRLTVAVPIGSFADVAITRSPRRRYRGPIPDA